jgi:2-dehydro-3-deoxyphosphogalactonate aldolase
MKIEGADVFTVRQPPEPRGGSEWYFLRLVTDEGVHGWGEMAFLGAQAGKHRSLEREVVEIAEADLVGQDPMRRERIWRSLYGRRCCHHPDLIRMAIISAFDMALWDIAGKALHRPVYELLGGKYRNRARAYSYIYDAPGGRFYGNWWGMWLSPDYCAERAAQMVEDGFNAMKLDPIPHGGGFEGPAGPWHLSMEMLERAEQTIRGIREAVGQRADILIGTHGQMTAAAAVRLARRLEPYDPLWFEEPVPPENADEMARVARSTTIPIATGERLTTVHGFLRPLQAQAVHIAQPDLASCGGITEAKKIAAMAEAHYVDLAPHVWGGPVVTAASLQIDACIPNFLIQESIWKSGGFFDQLVEEPFEWEDGCLLIPDRPGLGVELNLDALRAHAPT